MIRMIDLTKLFGGGDAIAIAANERDRELVVEDVRWRMVDGDVRHMAVDGDGERPVHRRRSLMKLISHEFLLLVDSM